MITPMPAVRIKVKPVPDILVASEWRRRSAQLIEQGNF
jgi:hypothetical protein